ncbi:hypothetical protein OUZ56_032333, partial [Daphnia magna]
MLKRLFQVVGVAETEGFFRAGVVDHADVANGVECGGREARKAQRPEALQRRFGERVRHSDGRPADGLDRARKGYRIGAGDVENPAFSA